MHKHRMRLVTAWHRGNLRWECVACREVVITTRSGFWSRLGTTFVTGVMRDV